MSEHTTYGGFHDAEAADHVSEARLRARQVLGSEAHLGAVDDWRRALVSARDALILTWVIWLALTGFGSGLSIGPFLLALTLALALLVGISTGRSTYLQVQYYESELERERNEIHNSFDHECDEVRALYAAKGFREPLLTQIVDTLTSDEDRLLKLMLEEELGLSTEHMNHPLVVGLWNFLGAFLAGGMLALPLIWLSPQESRVWMPAGGILLMGVVSVVSSRATRRSVVELFATGVVMATITGGVAYLLSQWLAGIAGGTCQP